MKNWQEIPIPQLMQDNCEKDPRGLPVPFVVLKDKEGKHHFKINDTEKTMQCMLGQLCTICGTKLNVKDRWLVGGIASAFDQKGFYIDHPVHKECAIYALKVCPYLAMRNYNGKIDLEKLQQQVGEEYQLNNPTVDQDRLPFFVLTRPSLTKYYVHGNDIIVQASKPLLETEFWDEGVKLTSLPKVLSKIYGTKWQKYGEPIKQLPDWKLQVA